MNTKSLSPVPETRRRTVLSKTASAMVLSLALCVCPAANAANATWTGSTNSTWTEGTNWSGGTAPSLATDVASFDNNVNTGISITGGLSILRMAFDSGAGAFTLTGAATTWSVPNGGGVTINAGVSATQDLSGIQFIRPAGGTTTNLVNQGSGLLKLGTIFNTNTVANANALLRFAPASGATIEIASGKTVDNASTANRTVSILIDDAGILKMAATGNFNGTDSQGNSVTIRQGTLQAGTINNAAGSRSSLGTNGRIQFGNATTTNTATLDYYSAGNATTDRSFYIIDNNTAVFKVSGGASTNLAITSNITQSAATNGGGKLTKDGVGTLTLSGNNTYTGDTLITNGKIALGSILALQNSAYDTTGSTGAIGLDVTGFATPTLGGLKGSVDLATAITGYGSMTGLTLNPQSGKTNTYTGIISDGAVGMTLTKTGSGTQVLSGNNTFTGAVTVNAGTLKLTSSEALGTGTKNFFMQGTGRILQLSNSITLGSNLTLTVSTNSGDGGGISSVDGNNEIQGPINISTGNPALNISSAAGTFTVSGNITSNSANRTLHLGGASTSANTISGVIGQSGANVLPVIKQGAGTWVLTGANTYTGSTTVNAGTLIISGTGSINTSANITVSTGATLANDTATALTPSLRMAEGSILSGIGSFSPFDMTLTADLTDGFTPIAAGSTLTKAGSLTLTLTGVVDGAYSLFTGSPVSAFASVNVGGNPLTFDGGDSLWKGSSGGFDYAYSDIANTLSVAAIPEPGTWILVGIGLTFLLFRKPRRRA